MGDCKLCVLGRNWSCWYLDFSEQGERNIGQAALLGELLTFTTYEPGFDLCQITGTSNLYGLFYKSGTAHAKPAVGTHTDVSNEEINTTKIELGDGMAITPNVHIGRAEGSKAFIQTSTGAIEVIEQINPGFNKSGRVSWEDRE